jgi:hypothetical protein
MTTTELNWAKLGSMVMSEPTTLLTFAAAGPEPVEVCFEPVGTTFELVDEQSVSLQLPLSVVSEVKVVVWPNGVGVWVPYPGDYTILDPDGRELDRL